MLEIFVDNGFILSWVDVGWVFGRFIDLGWIWGRFGVDFRSWEGLGRVFGRSWAALGSAWAPKIDFHRFWKDFEARLGVQNRPKSIKIRCQDALRFCIGFRDDFL